MKEPLRVGERIAVYCPHRYRATVIELDAFETGMNAVRFQLVKIKLDDGRSITVHPKQCRRLTKPKVPRRVWINVEGVELQPDCWNMAWGSLEAAKGEESNKPLKIVEFIEVMPDTTTVSEGKVKE